jgi:hypothetical protein
MWQDPALASVLTKMTGLVAPSATRTIGKILMNRYDDDANQELDRLEQEQLLVLCS